jgi:SAM-dependent methyltransferase
MLLKPIESQPRALARALARRAYHTLPARFWHSLDGLRRDLESLPSRLRDPERRKEPWEMLHHVGSNYRATGQHALNILRAYANLDPHDRVLDIGCGNGRVTSPLVHALSTEGGYIGFDVSRAAIRYCRRRFRTERPDFQFYHLDIHNGVYNPRGAVAELEARFPCTDGAITLAFANSVFTHLPLETIRHYLNETRRVLAPGGRAAFTAFVLTPQARDWIAAGRSPLPFKPWRDGAMTVDPHWPENAVAYDEAVLREAIEAAGLTLDRVLVGDWRPEPTYPGNQDMLIVRG